MNILIPMAGAGSRFKNAGYKTPKPLINVAGKTMIRRVIENLNLDEHYIFLVNKEQVEYGIKTILKGLVNDCTIIVVDELTDGAACTCLLAEKHIHNNEPLLIANCDQIMEGWSRTVVADKEPLYGYQDGIIFTFESTSEKNSYVGMNRYGQVLTCREKDVISDNACCGVFYFKRGKDFVIGASRMILFNDRVNDEFYVCPVYNYLPNRKDKKIITVEVDNHWPIGTPEDLEDYIGHIQA